MTKDLKIPFQDGRRNLLKGALISGIGVGSGVLPATQANAGNTTSEKGSSNEAPGYVFLTPSEADWVEALVNHMIPADHFTPSGSELGVNIFIDRALNDGWGKGDRLYLDGPWEKGTATQGYQLPLTPAQLYRSGIAASDSYCEKTYGMKFSALNKTQKEEFLKAMQSGKVVFVAGPPSKVFFDLAYQTVVEGFFADPIYGGNANKEAWKMLGFPGVIATHTNNISTYKNKPYSAKTFSIQDVS
jgi:gluconate 2-dehydrogenase gamma chain